uniref:Metalloendopeptidase OMA1, mitochondrial n=1 Tax=Cacopsylla melanoneura TaxID=428564 RepID=A0A8D8SHI8_9HEMI
MMHRIQNLSIFRNLRFTGIKPSILVKSPRTTSVNALLPHKYFQQNVGCRHFHGNVNISKITNYNLGKSRIILRKDVVLNSVNSRARNIHTSPPKYALPGLIYLIFKPILRVGAIIVARISRKRWQKLTPEEKRKIFMSIKKHQATITGLSLASIGLTYIYYFLNLETCPITGRQKFIIIKPNQLNEISGIAYDAFIGEHGNQVLPFGHPAYKRAENVVKRLLDANKMYVERNNFKYPITIVNDPTMNAFVLPDGRIFIFTGMFEICPTDDELATVLAHELSHTLLKHVAEKLSNKTLLEILYIVPLMIIWFLLPDLGAIITQVLLDDLKSILFELPFERDMETEADEVGLQMMARACYDVRIAPLFWKKMALKETQEQVGPKIEEFISTHPSHENRAKNLESRITEAMNLRKECNCLPLGPLTMPRMTSFRQIFNWNPAPPAG